jgi:hypothetical protein
MYFKVGEEKVCGGRILWIKPHVTPVSQPLLLVNLIHFDSDSPQRRRGGLILSQAPESMPLLSTGSEVSSGVHYSVHYLLRFRHSAGLWSYHLGLDVSGQDREGGLWLYFHFSCDLPLRCCWREAETRVIVSLSIVFIPSPRVTVMGLERRERKGAQLQSRERVGRKYGDFLPPTLNIMGSVVYGREVDSPPPTHPGFLLCLH